MCTPIYGGLVTAGVLLFTIKMYFYILANIWPFWAMYYAKKTTTMQWENFTGTITASIHGLDIYDSVTNDAVNVAHSISLIAADSTARRPVERLVNVVQCRKLWEAAQPLQTVNSRTASHSAVARIAYWIVRLRDDAKWCDNFVGLCERNHIKTQEWRMRWSAARKNKGKSLCGKRYDDVATFVTLQLQRWSRETLRPAACLRIAYTYMCIYAAARYCNHLCRGAKVAASACGTHLKQCVTL